MITQQKGRYQALELIGSGTTSRVQMARDNVIGRIVALKTFVHGFGEDLEETFLQEARLVGQLSHPAIVQLYDVGIDEQGMPFLVMEYIAGKTLDERLISFPLTTQRACAWAADLARGLSLAHGAGIIHGDIKPGNIFITVDEKVKLGDFGIARLTTQAAGSDHVKGTPAYLAPEQILGAEQDQRSDQFSFGIVFYQMLTGAKPFKGDSIGAVCSEILYSEPVPPSKLNPAVPPAVDRVIARCLAKNPLERFNSCDELVRSLYPFTRSRPRPTVAAGENRSWWTRPSGRFDLGMAAAACLLLAGSLQLPNLLRSRYGVPPAPAHSYYRPGVPYDAFSYTPQTVAPAPESDDSAQIREAAGSPGVTPGKIQVNKIALAEFNRPRNSQSPSSNQSTIAVRVTALPESNK